MSTSKHNDDYDDTHVSRRPCGNTNCRYNNKRAHFGCDHGEYGLSEDSCGDFKPVGAETEKRDAAQGKGTPL